MAPTYTVLGDDGKQYGPINEEGIRDWIRDGRVIANTQVWRSDQSEWKPASAHAELGIPAAAVAGTATAVATEVPAPFATTTNLDPHLEQRVKSGGSWFYWIAGFSVVNSIMTISGSEWGFALGLGISSLFDARATQAEGGVKMVLMALGFVAAAVIALLGFFAVKHHTWAFVVGMVLLALDTVLTGLFEMWIALAIHLFALFAIWGGFKACRRLKA
jgi:hypothetical protein